MTEKAIKNCRRCFLFSSLSRHMFALPCCSPHTHTQTRLKHVTPPSSILGTQHPGSSPTCESTDSYKCSSSFADGKTSIRLQGGLQEVVEGGKGGVYSVIPRCECSDLPSPPDVSISFSSAAPRKEECHRRGRSHVLTPPSLNPAHHLLFFQTPLSPYYPYLFLPLLPLRWRGPSKSLLVLPPLVGR